MKRPLLPQRHLPLVNPAARRLCQRQAARVSSLAPKLRWLAALADSLLTVSAPAGTANTPPAIGLPAAPAKRGVSTPQSATEPPIFAENNTYTAGARPNEGPPSSSPHPDAMQRTVFAQARKPLAAPPTINATLARAYANLRLGDLERAETDFTQALNDAPHSIPALLALATIAQFRRQTDRAAALRQRAWIADPTDANVDAAILNGRSHDIAPEHVESRLKTLLATQPDAAPLSFALGNLYARQRRWPEAQQAYAQAVAADDGNPDYHANLAISLDRLRQHESATKHYRHALAASASFPVGFDREAVRRRLIELSH